ncbi:hypothetical protein [Aliivibrio sifiae]|uniref:hypothetical protein n=1 Tax=Aliivibrio sifiae TaxID=566293 RepID=UPI003D122506
MKNHIELHSRLFVLNSYFRSHYSFIALEHYYYELDKDLGGLHPFTHMHNVLLCDAVTSWCKLFGSDKDEGHWKKAIPEVNHEKFREFLLTSTNLTLDEFSDYRQKMINFRNKWVVHHDGNYEHDPVPFFDIAHDSAVALHTYIRENADESIVYDGPECIVSFGKEVSNALISRLILPKT